MCGRVEFVPTPRREESMDDFLGNLFGSVERRTLKQKQRDERLAIMARAQSIMDRKDMIQSVQATPTGTIIQFRCRPRPGMPLSSDCVPLQIAA